MFAGKPAAPSLRELLTSRGAVLRASVSGNTDYVVSDAPAKGAAKISAAAALGIPVITVFEVMKMADETEE